MLKVKIPIFLWVLLAAVACENANEKENPVISLDKNIAHLEINKTLILKATVIPHSSEEVVWTSSNESVATVLRGIVTPVGEGKAVVTASIKGSSANCQVFVTLEEGTYYGEYELVWEEEFLGTTLNPDYWNIETGGGGWGNQEKQYYTGRGENLRVENGYLIIEARKEKYMQRDYTSARITTKEKKDFKYGKIEARISLPKGGGTWPAFWMMGYGNWPFCGEIDIVEHVGNRPDGIIHALHTQEKNGMRGNNWSNHQTGLDVEESFHVFGIEWLQKYQHGRDAIRFYIDDKVSTIVYQPTSEEDLAKWPFNKKFYIIMNVALGGTLGGNINDNIFDIPVQMKVDWVHVYQKKL